MIATGSGERARFFSLLRVVGGLDLADVEV